MFEDSNTTTQPLKPMAVFNNWDAVVEAWYCVGDLSELDRNELFSTKISNQELIVFKAKDGKVHCLDAFCSHMGLRLSTGTVEGDSIQCKFHHWRYNGQGEASDSGCKKLHESKNLKSYPVEVR